MPRLLGASMPRELKQEEINERNDADKNLKNELENLKNEVINDKIKELEKKTKTK